MVRKAEKWFNNGFGEDCKTVHRDHVIQLMVNFAEHICNEKLKKLPSDEMNRNELNQMAKKYISNAGFGIGTNITLHGLKCMMVDFYLDNQLNKLPKNVVCVNCKTKETDYWTCADCHEKECDSQV